MSGTRVTKTFNFCCTRALANQYNSYLKSGKKPERTQISCSGDCPRDFKLGEFSIMEQSFFFNYNNWWYVFNIKDNVIETFCPAVGVYDKDPHTFAGNLVREGLLTKLGIKLLFGDITQEEYVQTAMIELKYDRSTMVDDFNIIMKFRMWYSLTTDKQAKIEKYKEMAVSLLNE